MLSRDSQPVITAFHGSGVTDRHHCTGISARKTGLIGRLIPTFSQLDLPEIKATHRASDENTNARREGRNACVVGSKRHGSINHRVDRVDVEPRDGLRRGLNRHRNDRRWHQ